jgi:hypothetical protein
MKLVWLFFFSILLSCNSKDDLLKSERQKLSPLFRELGITNSSNSILIIVPVSGCKGCISRTLNFALEESIEIDINYIVSGYGKKNILFNIDKELLTASYVFIDDKGLALTKGLIDYFPVLYLFKDDNIIKIVELNAINIEEVLSTLRG